MAKNILTYPIEQFERDLPSIDNRNLVSLIRGIYAFKWEYGKNFSDEQIKDIERKQTKIERELMRRKYLDKKSMGEYQKMLHDINYRKRVY